MHSWQPLLERLLAFKAAHGHCNVPHPWLEDPQLSQWVVNLRQQANRLPQALQQALQEAGFDFSSAGGFLWRFYYEQLERFHRQYGHVQVPAQEKAYGDLYGWMKQQRQSRPRLSPEQILLLNQLGFCWQKPTFAGQWEEKYQELMAFHERHGHSRVAETSAEHPHLGSWVARQRKQEHQGKLSPERKGLLDELGFEWRGMDGRDWQRMYGQLEQFYHQYGHCNPGRQQPESKQLGRWVMHQRKKRDQLSEGQRAQLDRLGFRWQEDIRSQKEVQWEAKYNRLRQFYQQHGHSKVRESDPDKALAHWVDAQRCCQRLGQLPPHRVKKLNQLGFSWRADNTKEREENWQQMYERLLRFKQQYGHCRVARKNSPDPELGRWVAFQRQRWERLPPERKEQLLALGFISLP